MKSKSKKQYVCSDCGIDAIKWQGQCPECKEWNTLKEINLGVSPFINSASHISRKGFSGTLSKLQKLNDISVESQFKFSSGFCELDRVLGGGFVKGGIVLIGGNPGAGKSTLLLQVLCNVAKHMETLYVSGEESLNQIALRAHRLGLEKSNLHMLAETSIDKIAAQIQQCNPGIIVIDSIQVMFLKDVDATPGGAVQVREAASMLTHIAKSSGAVVIIIGHVTKDNSLAGPMTLSHIVDTQLMINNTDDNRFRIIRAIKNRFGQVNEIGVFSMADSGMKEVKNPSAIFLNRTNNNAYGSIITASWEGTRSLLIEIQALVADSPSSNPRRVALGIDSNRLNMLLAILSRHGGIFTADQDVFVNVVSGVRINETGADLPAVLAIASSLQNKPISGEIIAFGEIGLSGEIRPVANGLERITEAVKYGFTKMIIPIANIPKKKSFTKKIEIIGVKNLAEAINAL